MRRYPTAEEVERVAECLGASPRTPSSISRESRVRFRHVCGALRALKHQGRAVRFGGQGWRARA